MASIKIPALVTSIGNNVFEYDILLKNVEINSVDVYTSLTSLTSCGFLINSATTIKDSASIIDAGAENAYLNNEESYTRSETAIDGYYVFTKVGA